MKIDKNQIDLSKRKLIGKLKKAPVYELFTKGGYCLVMSAGSEGKVLGVGPHRAVARHIAQVNEPDLLIEELSKSEDLPLTFFEHIIPHWAEITAKVNSHE